MNFDDSHNGLNDFDRDLRSKLDDWEPGETPDLWEELSESLALESVWERLDKGLSAGIPDFDHQLQESYREWNPAPEADAWNKIDQSLSVENVWRTLSGSLSEPVCLTTPWMKIAVACIVALVIGNRVSDGNVRFEPESGFASKGLVNDNRLTANDISNDRNSGSQQNIAATNGSSSLIPSPSDNEVKRRNSQEIENGIQSQKNPENTSNGSQTGFGPDVIVSQSVQEGNDNKENHYSPQSEEIASLNRLSPDYSNGEALVLMSLKEPKKIVSDRWTLQIGTQASVMKEINREQLTSALPGLGLAADIAYRKRLGNLQLIGAFGISQYTQAAGKYMNGRYSSAEQKVSTLQLTGSLGYGFGRTTFYGGVVISNMFHALEENGNKITQVYRFRDIEPGMTAGVDYRIFEWSRMNRPVSIGLQYQYLPGNVNGAAGSTFEKMHGIRLQAKFGF